MSSDAIPILPENASKTIGFAFKGSELCEKLSKQHFQPL
jgi:hypothetical protein